MTKITDKTEAAPLSFDLDAALTGLKAGRDLTGKDGVLAPLIKRLTEAAMQAELEAHLAAEDLPNRKNGVTRKTVKSAVGPFELDTPRDRLDAIHYKVRVNNRYVSKAIYTILGLNIEGRKELLGLYLSDQEGAHHWLDVLTDLHSRGVKDLLIACVDGLKGFPEAIATVYPKAEVQHCIVHQIRNSLKYVASKNHKEFLADLKAVYDAPTLNAAEQGLDALEAKWGPAYPKVIESWRSKWPTLSTYYQYPDYVRRAIYTINAVEAVHRQFRKLTKTKGGFASESALLMLLYAGILKASERWTRPIQNWNLVLSQLMIRFPGQLEPYVTL